MCYLVSVHDPIVRQYVCVCIYVCMCVSVHMHVCVSV